MRWRVSPFQQHTASQHSTKNRLKLKLEHVFSHGCSPANECADHAAALGAFGLVSSHNPVHLWPGQRIETLEALLNNHRSDLTERLQTGTSLIPALTFGCTRLSPSCHPLVLRLSRALPTVIFVLRVKSGRQDNA